MATYPSPLPYYPYYVIPTPGPKLGGLPSPSRSPRTFASPFASPYTLPVHPNVVFASPNPHVWVVPPPYTPAPVHAGLSPVSSLSEELQEHEPEEPRVGKWEAARTGYLYDNKDSPVSLNSVHNVLDVNPVLTHGTIPLIVDLSRRLDDITTSEVPGQPLWFENLQDVFSQPATVPRVTRLRLLSPKTKYTINIVARTGVTVSTQSLAVLSCC